MEMNFHLFRGLGDIVMINAIYAAIWLGALWIWGDWRNWRTYYPTILFFILGDFLYLLLLSDSYPMWRYVPPDVDQKMGVTNKIVSLSIIAIKYPSTAIIYLSRFPENNKLKGFLYTLCWVLIYLMNEFIDVKFNLIKYYNGWNLWWSALFSAAIFVLLRIHFKTPIFAWGLSAMVIVVLWNIFDVPFSVFK